VTRDLPEVSGARLKRALKRAGFVEVHTRGSHCKLRHPASRITVIVPMHNRVRPGTLSSILQHASISVDELRDLL
jgi:predicted RNA binding protein YcfA (HicA-like mRNA interferase family)